jgi:hypothetical protein
MPLASAPTKPPSPRKKGIRFGAKILFASIVTFPVIMAIAIAGNSPGPLAITFLLFLLGISRMTYARLFEDDEPTAALPQPVFAPPSVAGALAAYRAPVSFATPRGATTGELQAPPSVTEHTTNLLDQEAHNPATDWSARRSTEGNGH